MLAAPPAFGWSWGHTLEGTIYDQHGDPVEGVQVRLAETGTPPNGGDVIRRQMTDWAGDYSFTYLPGGRFVLYVRDPAGNYATEYFEDRWTARDADWVSLPWVMFFEPGVTRQRDMRIGPAGTLQGAVTGSGDAPLKGVDVDVFGWDGWQWRRAGTAATNAGGTYQVGGLGTGPYRVRFTAGSDRYATEWFADRRVLGDADEVDVVAGTPVTGVDAQLALSGHVSGQFLDTHGYPVERGIAEAWCRIAGGEWRLCVSTQAGPDGRYDLGGMAAGDYTIRFRDAAGVFLPEYYDDAPDADAAAPVTVSTGGLVPNVDAELARRGGIRGTVVNGDGEPLDGVDVWVYGRANGDWEYVCDSSTDSSGSYLVERLDPGAYRVRFYGRARPDESGQLCFYPEAPTLYDADDVAVVPDRLTRDVDIVLDHLGSLHGTVAAAGDSTPLQGIRVTAYMQDEDWGTWEYIADTSTDAGGHYDLAVPGRNAMVRVGFTDPGEEYRAEFWDDAGSVGSARSVPVAWRTAVDGIDARLEDGGSIGGVVTRPTGVPLRGVHVQLFDPAETGYDYLADVTTDSAGAYTFRGLAGGDYRVYFSRWGVDRSPVWYDGATTRSDAQTVTIVDGEDRGGIDTVMYRQGSVEGTVTDAYGTPLEGAAVLIYHYSEEYGAGWSQWNDIETDASGHYRFSELDAGRYRVKFRAHGFAGEWWDDTSPASTATTIDVGFGEDVPGIDAALAGDGSISGTVTGEDGQPAEGVGVFVYRSDGSGGWDRADYVDDSSAADSGFPFFGTSPRTDNHGRYRVGGLAPGTYRVGFGQGLIVFDDPFEFWPDAPDLASATDVPLAPGQDRGGIDVWLSGLATITGRVTDTLGAGLAGVYVRAWNRDERGEWSFTATGWTDADGRYRIEDLAAGDYRLQIDFAAGDQDGYIFPSIYECVWYPHEASIDAALDVMVPRGGTAGDFDFVLRHDAEIAGVFSPTHPSAGTWYAEDDVTLSWTPVFPATAFSYSYVIDHDPATAPPKTWPGAPEGVTFTDLADGEWWFHVRGADLYNSWSPAAHYRVRIDTMAPTTTDDNTGGWYKSPAEIHLTAADAHSGVATTWWFVSPEPWSEGTTATVSGTGSYLLYHRSIDNAGNVEVSGSTMVYVDGWAPTTAVSGNDAAWHKDPVTLTFTPTDAHSGMSGGEAKTEYRVDGGAWTTGLSATVSANGTHAVDYRSTDAVGNLEAYQTATVLIDTVAPATTDDADGAWHATPVTVTLTPTDTQSGMVGGLATTEYRLDGGPWTSGTAVVVSAPADHSSDGVHAILYRSTDAVGNTESTGSCAVRIDTRAPETTDDAPAGWQAGPVTVHLAATDTQSGMTGGLAQTEYKLDGAADWTVGTSVDVGGDGVHSLVYRSTDAVGNVEAERDCTVRIESSAPTTTDDTDPGWVWYNHDVTVHFTATDPDSGIDYTEWSTDGGAGWTHGAEVTITADPLGHTTDGEHRIHYRSADLAGHVEAVKGCWVRIDTQGPDTTPLARASVRRGHRATLRYRVDEHPFPSGATADVTIRINNRAGRPVKRLRLGPQTVNSDRTATFRCKLRSGRYRWWIYAVDSAGNPQATIGKGYLRVR